MLLLNYNWHLNSFLAQSSSSSESAGANIVFLVFTLFGYLFSSYCFYNIYEKLGEENAWFAWVPILNNWIMYKVGGQSPWWVVGLFIPLVNIVAAVFLLMALIKIVEKLGKNPWLILLMIVPIVNFVILYNFAFG
ncbi:MULTISPECIES: DUF5684 domain-containing protein [unclassified Anabaena]|uniref:DUF5684 domain-containing protein n=1 Tax=unclassified Anabaena TaxID=2619674 RepID=UPI0014465434|nr:MULTISPECIES: DUF5684 domain-containing protein [unclassified Anabaena]MTJ10883.1 hypothetical protein [Anabaena sp. UHCC 0204]MTJ55335.1 hypothetical protein [Anabaena sp. UHCC 0253]